MRVLVACEYSGTVREAFRKLGHDAWSCDLLPCDDGSPYHYQGDCWPIIEQGWDLIISTHHALRWQSVVIGITARVSQSMEKGSKQLSGLWPCMSMPRTMQTRCVLRTQWVFCR